MDFFERIFHIAPDGGNGFSELMVLLGVVVLCISIARFNSVQRRELGE